MKNVWHNALKKIIGYTLLYRRSEPGTLAWASCFYLATKLLQTAGVAVEATGCACDESLTNYRLEVTTGNAVSCCSAVPSGDFLF